MLILLLGAVLAAAPRVAAPVRPAWTAALAQLSPARLEADVRELADDRYEGRGTGTRGYDAAAAYVAARMESLGLAPGGTEGFLQPVALRRADVDHAASRLALVRDGQTRVLLPGDDVQVGADFLREKVTTETEVVYVGWGVSAPELGHDDYAGVDVRGKVVALFRGAPPRFEHNLRAYYSNPLVKEQAAAGHGAIGVLEMRRPAEERRAPWAKVSRQGRLPAFRWTDEGGAPANTQALLQVGARLSPTGAQALFEGAPVPLERAVAMAESSVVGSFELPGRLHAIRVTRHTAVSSPNVVGVLRGSDPKLANECIVVSAHLDHLGIGVPVNGDSIHNGAYDNATGIAMMLEAARVLRTLRTAPKRSIVFLAVTGEEKGLQGSDWFARHPAPLGLDVVGNVNLDMVLLQWPLRAVIAFGAEHSTLGDVVEWAARQCSLAVIPDPVPQEVVFVRSDQFSFVKQGVPAIYPVAAGDGRPESTHEHEAWTRDVYHSPADDASQHFDWASGARFTRLAALTILRAADDADRPRWRRGDWFGERFGAKR